MNDRARLQEALTLIAAEGSRFGEATVATAIAVLNERLASLPEPALPSESARRPDTEQRKQATILFAAIDGFTRLASATPNTARLRKIDMLWRRLDETIHEYGGIVDKHMGDVIMGIFGAPLARENDPERAVRCALALRELMAEYLAAQENGAEATAGHPQPVFRIGINTGQVSLGQVGSDAGQTAIGDAVNVASRLKEAAGESGIYISYDTYHLVRNLFRVEPLGQVSIKGRRATVTVYRVVGHQPPSFFPAAGDIDGVDVPLVGRESELATLRHLMERTALEGRGGVVSVVGEAGVGKSRLFIELHRRLDERPSGVAVYLARADQRLSGVPFYLLRDLFLRAFGIVDDDSPRQVERRIVDGLRKALAELSRPEARERARAVGLLLGLGSPPAPLRASAGPDVAAVRALALDTIRDYFAATARAASLTLLFLEDVQWADDDSLALLEEIAEAATECPMLLLCAARPTLLERRPAWPGPHPEGAFVLPLRPLSHDDSRKLLVKVLTKLPEIPTSLIDLIVRSAAGNPFYIEEMVRVLIEDGIIVADEAAWHLRDRQLTRLRVPATLTGVLQARIDRLPGLERVTLQQAAVIGDEFWEGAVQQINLAARSPFSEEQVRDALQGLERRDMIMRVSAPAGASGQTYRFRHTILREVAYESVLLRDRPGYHLQAVRWLETQFADMPADYAAPIAHHYEQAGRPADAAHMFEQAAARAVEQFKLPTAINYYRKVLDLLRPLPQYIYLRYAVKEGLGHVLRLRGRMVEALDVYGIMRDNAELDGNLSAQARAEQARAAIYLELADAPRALAAAERAAQLARLTGDDVELVQALLSQGEAAGRMGDWAAGSAALAEALERSRALGAMRSAARALFLVTRLSDDEAARRRAAGELAALAGELEKDGPDDDAAGVLFYLGESYMVTGAYNDAAAAYEQALARGGEPALMSHARQRLGTAARRAGDAAGGMAHLEAAAQAAEAAGNRYRWLFCRLAMGEALLAQGRLPAAEATLRQVIATAENRQRLGTWVKLDEAYRLLAAVLREEGRWDEAWLLERRG